MSRTRHAMDKNTRVHSRDEDDMTSFDPSDTFTAETMEAAREWLLDLDWADQHDADDSIRNATVYTVMTAVERYYDGGIAAFVSDAS